MEINEINVPLNKACKMIISHLKSAWAGRKVSTPYIVGKPGGGKSEMMRHLCSSAGIGYMSISISLVRAERFTGLPRDVERTTTDGRIEVDTDWSVPEIVASLRKLGEENKYAICLFDDFHRCSPEIMQVGFELFTDHSINGYAIPKNVRFVLAGNNSAAAGARAEFSAILNRVCKYYVTSDFDYWRDNYAEAHGLNQEFISFLNQKSNRHLFHGEESMKSQWPSPRSWTECMKVVDQYIADNVWEFEGKDRDVLHAIVAGHVGHQAASEFMLYHDIYSKINAEAIFNTGTYTFPSDPVERFAFGSAVTTEYYNRMSDDGADAKTKEATRTIFCNVLNDMEQSVPEIALRSIRWLGQKKVSILTELCSSAALSKKTLSKLANVSSVLAR